MEIDLNLDSSEIHKRIFDHVRTLGVKRRFKPVDEFEEKWFQSGDADKLPFILIPHSSFDASAAALSGPYPNVWIRYDAVNGNLEYGLAFWSASAVDERFANFAQDRYGNQKSRVLSILKALPDGWTFRVEKKKKHGPDEIAFESKCNAMGEAEILKVIADIPAWRLQWKKEATLAINLMCGSSKPADSDHRLIELFNAFDEIAEMTPSKRIKVESKAARKEIQAKIDNLSKNLEKSQYKSEIQSRLRALLQELEAV